MSPNDYQKMNEILDRWYDHALKCDVKPGRGEYYLGFRIGIQCIRKELTEYQERELEEMFQEDAQRSWKRLSEKMKKDLNPVIEGS